LSTKKRQRDRTEKGVVGAAGGLLAVEVDAAQAHVCRAHERRQVKVVAGGGVVGDAGRGGVARGQHRGHIARLAGIAGVPLKVAVEVVAASRAHVLQRAHGGPAHKVDRVHVAAEGVVLDVEGGRGVEQAGRADGRLGVVGHLGRRRPVGHLARKAELVAHARDKVAAHANVVDGVAVDRDLGGARKEQEGGG